MSHRPSRAAAGVALCALLAAGCADQPSTTPGSRGPARTTAPTATPAVTARRQPQASRTTRPSRYDGRGSWRLLPRACRDGDLRVTPGPRLEPATGERGVLLAVRDVADTPCWLGGYSRVRLLDRDGAPLPFRMRAGGPYSRKAPPAHVVVRPGRPAYVQLAKYRCDRRTVASAATAVVTLPGLARRRRVAVGAGLGLPLCGPQDPPQVVGVTPVRERPSQLGGIGPVPDRSAVEMHTLRDPRLAGRRTTATYGRADVDGDGRDDVVVVRTTGVVSLEGTRVGHTETRVPAGPTLRLQGLPDLVHSGRADLLVAATAAGCCAAYRLPDTRSLVLRLVGDRLRVVTWRGGRPLGIVFDRGRGDLYAGLRCGDGGMRLVSGSLDDIARVTVRALALTGATASRGPAHRRVVRRDSLPARTATRCPGLGPDGWAG